MASRATPSSTPGGSRPADGGGDRPKARPTYGVVRVLGQGAYGKVYLVVDRQDRRHYVMKVIRLSGMCDADVAAARNEVDLMKRLGHPNVVGFRESFLRHAKRGGGEQLCIVMTYCDGGDMAARLQRQAKEHPGQLFSESVVMSWFVQMALGLQNMHANLILHRDLKSLNVFLLGAGRLVLGDFGVSKSLDRGDALARTQIGTPYYMSPELFKNQPYSFASDVWALGCILFEMVTLTRPFEASSLGALAMAVISGDPKPVPRSTPRGIQALLKSMLEKDPKKRPNMSQILRRPYVAKHVGRFLSDIMDREEGTISDGTLELQSAIAKALAPRTTLELSRDARALAKQLHWLGLEHVVEASLGPTAAAAIKASIDLESAADSASSVPAGGARTRLPPPKHRSPKRHKSRRDRPRLPVVRARGLLSPASSAAAPPTVDTPMSPAAGDVPPPDGFKDLVVEERAARRAAREAQRALERAEERRQAAADALARLEAEKALRRERRRRLRAPAAGAPTNGSAASVVAASTRGSAGGSPPRRGGPVLDAVPRRSPVDHGAPRVALPDPSASPPRQRQLPVLQPRKVDPTQRPRRRSSFADVERLMCPLPPRPTALASHGLKAATHGDASPGLMPASTSGTGASMPSSVASAPEPSGGGGGAGPGPAPAKPLPKVRGATRSHSQRRSSLSDVESRGQLIAGLMPSPAPPSAEPLHRQPLGVPPAVLASSSPLPIPVPAPLPQQHEPAAPLPIPGVAAVPVPAVLSSAAAGSRIVAAPDAAPDAPSPTAAAACAPGPAPAPAPATQTAAGAPTAAGAGGDESTPLERSAAPAAALPATGDRSDPDLMADEVADDHEAVVEMESRLKEQLAHAEHHVHRLRRTSQILQAFLSHRNSVASVALAAMPAPVAEEEFSETDSDDDDDDADDDDDDDDAAAALNPSAGVAGAGAGVAGGIVRGGYLELSAVAEGAEEDEDTDAEAEDAPTAAALPAPTPPARADTAAVAATCGGVATDTAGAAGAELTPAASPAVASAEGGAAATTVAAPVLATGPEAIHVVEPSPELSAPTATTDSAAEPEPAPVSTPAAAASVPSTSPAAPTTTSAAAVTSAATSAAAPAAVGAAAVSPSAAPSSAQPVNPTGPPPAGSAGGAPDAPQPTAADPAATPPSPFKPAAGLGGATAAASADDSSASAGPSPTAAGQPGVVSTTVPATVQ